MDQTKRVFPKRSTARLPEMTSRERIIAAMNFEPVDHIPVYDLLRNDAVIRFYAGERLTVKDGFRIACKASAACLDATRNLEGPKANGRSEVKGGIWKGLVMRQERWTEWVEYHPVRQMPDAVEWVKRYTRYCERWQPSKTYIHEYRARYRRYERLAPGLVVLHDPSSPGFDPAYHNVGWEHFSVLIHEKPDLISTWLEALCEKELRRIHTVADPDLSPAVLTFSDIACKSGLMFSPELLRREFIPRLARIQRAWKSHGVRCLFHSDGDLSEILDDLIAAGIDGVNPLELCANYDIYKVKQKYGKRIFLAGGVDVSNLLVFGSEEEVRQEVEKVIRICGRGGGLWIGSTTELGNRVPLANFQALVETARSITPS